MIISNKKKPFKNIVKHINDPVFHSQSPFNISKYTKLSKKILSITKKYPTPFYLLDIAALKTNLVKFQKAFHKYYPLSQGYYSIKANYHKLILDQVLQKQYGLEVGSLWELQNAIDSKAKNIIINGPGKTLDDINRIISLKNNIILIIDSLNEINLLKSTKPSNKKITVGIRIKDAKSKSWDKFGINIQELYQAWTLLKQIPYLNLSGIHFHTSGNGNISHYHDNIRRIGSYLKNKFSSEMIENIEFIDIGGGFRSENSYGYYPWKLLNGTISPMVNSIIDGNINFRKKYDFPPVINIDTYAKEITDSIKLNIPNNYKIKLFYEPGKSIVTDVMNIICTVADIKDNIIILNGSLNLVNIGSRTYDYTPIINLSNPSNSEINYRIYGSLCTQQLDLWGFYAYAKKFKIGDIVMITNQGAYTYSLAQRFGADIAPVYSMK